MAAWTGRPSACTRTSAHEDHRRYRGLRGARGRVGTATKLTSRKRTHAHDWQPTTRPWDLMQAVLKLVRSTPIPGRGYPEEQLAPHLALNSRPNPTCHSHRCEQQSVNFLLWHLRIPNAFTLRCAGLRRQARSMRDRLVSRRGALGRSSEQLEKASAKRRAGGSSKVSATQAKRGPPSC